ncbi:hypothetical protein ACWDUL_21000 [Nocardia niigatensis]
MPKPVMLTGVSAEFTADEIECLVRGYAELWATTGDPNDVLSAYQKEIVERALNHYRNEDQAAPALLEAVPATPNAAFVVAHNDPIPFTVDEDAFKRWLAESEEDVMTWTPTSYSDEPASDLVALIDSAVASGVLIGDLRLTLLLDAWNTRKDPGFTLMLQNNAGDQENVAVTTGFTALCYADSALTTAEAARHHLDGVAEIANGLLHLIVGHL